ncbi:MAG: hypothetical protein KGS47_01860 [Chloroflexi bacterium]|nr:hypothetical protein [Chloroflexota bacterium]
MSTGAGWPTQAACTASARKVRTSRCCWQQVVTTDSIRSMNRLPAVLGVPMLGFRQIHGEL